MNDMMQPTSWNDIINTSTFQSTYHELQQARHEHHQQQVQAYHEAAYQLKQRPQTYRTLAGIPINPFHTLHDEDNIHHAVVRITKPDLISLFLTSNDQTSHQSIDIKLVDVWTILCKHCRVASHGFISSHELCNAFDVDDITSYLSLSYLLGDHIELVHGHSVAQYDAEFMTYADAIKREAPPSPIPIAVAIPSDSIHDDDDQSTNQQLMSVQDSVPDEVVVSTQRPKHNLPVQRARPDLEKIVGYRYLRRPSAIRLLWNYGKSRGLQSAENGKVINCDESLKALFGGEKSVTFIEMLTLLTPLLTIVNPSSPEYEDAVKEADAAADMLELRYPNRNSRRTKRKALAIQADEDEKSNKPTTKRERDSITSAPKRKRRAPIAKRPVEPVSVQPMESDQDNSTETDSATASDNSNDSSGSEDL